MRKELAGRVERAIEERVFPGCVIGIAHAGGEREVLPFGRFTYELGAPSVGGRTVYDVASVTKSIPTASLALLLIAEGKLALADTVKKHIPELENDQGATIEDLLRYRVQGVQLSTLRYKTFEEIRTHILESGFSAPPGEGAYTNLPAFLLGLVVERVGGHPLPVLAHERLFGPFAMNDSTFFPSSEDCAPTEIEEGKDIRGVPHDESARVFARARRAVGHAGLFSTAPDLLNFLEALLKGELPDVLSGARQGLGWQTEGEFLGSGPSGRFGKTGFTGTSITCDPSRGAALVILSNRTYPKRPPKNDAIKDVRRDLADIALVSS